FDRFQPFDRHSSKIPRNAQLLQLKQILVTGDVDGLSTTSDSDAGLKKSVLSSVLQLQTMIEDQVLEAPFSLWNRDMHALIQDGHVLDTVTENLDTNDYLFKDLRSTSVRKDSNSSSLTKESPALVLSYAFDANGPFQARLGHGWSSKVAHLQTPTLKSQSRVLEDEKSVPAWTAAALLDVAHKKASTIDVVVILTAYFIMFCSFGLLFVNMRKLGSQFTLGVSVLAGGAFAFMGAVITVHQLGVYINPIQLSEAIPFFIITVGYERAYTLSKAVLRPTLAAEHVPESIRGHVVSAIESVGPILIRNCTIEIALELRRIRESSKSPMHFRELTLKALLGSNSINDNSNGNKNTPSRGASEKQDPA
ncbi:3-hydroxy-3-methylglutaryl-coenzyme A (HMG-CoA) reductase isozyme, partial [Lunasporangiospora selenospora]